MPNALPPRPLVGRTNELEVLSRTLDSARAESGSSIFLKGDTGTGKSRLASAVVEKATQLGFETVSGQAYRMDTGSLRYLLLIAWQCSVKGKIDDG